MPIDPTYLFGDFKIAVATAGKSKFGHSFGGPHDRKGCARDDCGGIHIHLLHRLNLRDPAIPFVVPEVSWAPFYYCFDYRVNDLGYRLLSDERMETYIPTDDPHVTASEQWPGESYPLEFPTTNVKLYEFAYDPTQLEDAYCWAGVFGIDKLSPDNQAEARRRVAEEQRTMYDFVPETDEEFAQAFELPFPQSRPLKPCLNPGCPNRKRDDQLETIALIPGQPVKGVHTFGTYGDDVVIIVQKCPACHAFRVSNQCT